MCGECTVSLWVRWLADPLLTPLRLDMNCCSVMGCLPFMLALCWSVLSITSAKASMKAASALGKTSTLSFTYALQNAASMRLRRRKQK